MQNARTIDPQCIWSSSRLPTLPAVAVRLLELSQDPNCEMREVVATIKADPAISAKILKATNSSYFGFSSTVTSIERAVPLLGTTVITSLALSFSLAESTMTAGPLVDHYNSYWLQSVIQASAAQMLSHVTSGGVDCELFLSGLLLDLGRLAMLKTIPDDYRRVLERVIDRRAALHEVESALLGFNHVGIGSRLAENWKLPSSLVRAVEMHEAPTETLVDGQNGAEEALIRATAVAAAVGEYFCTTNKGPAFQRLQELTSVFYGFGEEQLNAYIDSINVRLTEISDLFSLNIDRIAPMDELLSQANEHLAQLAMRQYVESNQAMAKQQVAEEEKCRLESQNKQLQRQALHDPLTKIYNRYYFDAALTEEISRCSRNALPVAVIFADIDHFKHVNDTYGHQFGDIVLQRVAQVFQSMLRNSDVLARYGGEEFVVLASQPTEKGMAALAERIRARVDAEQIHFAGEVVPVTVSIGAAIAIPRRKDDDLAARMLAAADEAMYTAKQSGRNRFRVHSLLDDAERHELQLIMQRRFSRWLVKQDIFDVPTVSSALLTCHSDARPIGELAKQLGVLNADQVDDVMHAQQSNGERFGRTAIELGYLSESQLIELLAFQQEPPRSLALAITATGLMSTQRVEELLAEFASDCVVPIAVAVS